MANDYEKVAVCLPPEVDFALCEAAKAKGVSVSRYASHCVEALIEELKARKAA